MAGWCMVRVALIFLALATSSSSALPVKRDVGVALVSPMSPDDVKKDLREAIDLHELVDELYQHAVKKGLLPQMERVSDGDGDEIAKKSLMMGGEMGGMMRGRKSGGDWWRKISELSKDDPWRIFYENFIGRGEGGRGGGGNGGGGGSGGCLCDYVKEGAVVEEGTSREMEAEAVEATGQVMEVAEVVEEATGQEEEEATGQVMEVAEGEVEATGQVMEVAEGEVEEKEAVGDGTMAGDGDKV
ncbi:uncharacterized protein LOC110980941 [Acanthaster planci]|uniref:Uncharacterized protein LOC110980941 n=1 Tax=Acanthaster planci TaxID=133434 RepID=A0A8B7YKC4_ACAPL|nr:uncharacterized protein LOC110980941 [Acanthaster planci]